MSTYYKQRSIEAHETIKKRILGAVKNFEASFESSSVFEHNLSKGEHREKPIQTFFRDLLPNKFSVTSGEIIDYKGNTSPQSDVIIFRNSDGIPLFQTEPTIIQVESVMSIIEVKSKITAAEYKDCLIKTEKINRLKPFGKTIQQSERGRKPGSSDTRIFTSIFAYSSDMKGSLKDEYKRYLNKANELNISPLLIDRIYILNKGIINPTDNIYSEENLDKRAFLYFYSNLLQFLQREASRRNEVPYLEYFGRMTGGWDSYE